MSCSVINFYRSSAGLESLSEDDSHLTHHPSESCEVDQLSLAEVHEEVTNEEEEDIGGEIEIKVEDAFDTQVNLLRARSQLSTFSQ